ncbi:nitrous oxide reductase family maturation protein NosD [Microbacterium sp.]|uniref:right-handed parallel beta-helix repeat-containing protein n=1 Tax=Microbacterium sp. TaxID=51671 RepID=UPI0039E6AAE0
MRATTTLTTAARGSMAMLAALLCGALLTGCDATGPSGSGDAVVRVPEDTASLQEAADRVAEGGVIEIAAGVYDQTMLVSTPDVTVRGADRNETVVDGGGIRPYGIVGIADGITIENLTVTGALYYGVLVTGTHDENGPSAHGGAGYQPFDPAQFPPLQRFLIDHVTAYNNGLYGIYAFNSQHGVIRDSYASGSADSGFYVGQCEGCDILVTGNVAENNAVGFENANASDSVVIAGNRFAGNRVGMTLLSNYQEAFSPQSGNTIVGNLVWGNDAGDSPAQADGAFALGIGISGGRDNVFERNLIGANAAAGVQFANTEDLAASGNDLRGNTFETNGVDVANTSAARAPAAANCADAGITTLPATLGDALATCAATQEAAEVLPAPAAPEGVSFLRVAAPPAQPQLDAPASAPLPETVELPDLAAFDTPTSALLADRSRMP